MSRRTIVWAAVIVLPLLILAGLALPAQGGVFSAPAALSAGTVFDALEATLGDIYDQVTPSVVNIQVVQGAAAHPQVPGVPADPGQPEQPYQPRGLGSGFVWDKEGHIVTNNHVVADAEEITVTFLDNTTVPAEVVGTDPQSDLAVIKVDLPPEKLQPVRLADSTDVHVGQLAVAIGNPFGLEGTMTVGFVSALGRSLPVDVSDPMAPVYTIPDIIQTDAPINPGNSGGVLVDDEGRVIGVPTAIESPVRASAGIGFAIPSVIVQKVVPALIERGEFEHPWLGLSGTSLNSELAEAMGLDAGQRGVLVVEVVEGGPAAQAGLRGGTEEIELQGRPVRIGGDVIVAINDQPVAEFEDLVTYLARSASAGETVTLTVLREGRQIEVDVTLGTRPRAETPAPQSQLQAPMSAGAWLGIRGLTMQPEIARAMDLPADQGGVLIEEVVENSPADKAHLLGGNQVLNINGRHVVIGGDVILAVDGQSVESFEDLAALVQQAEVGQQVALSLLRDGQEIKVEVTLGERPASLP